MFNSSNSGFQNFMLIYILFMSITFLYSVLAALFWKRIFTDADKKRRQASIPFYNLAVLTQVCEISPYWFLLFLFPITNIILIIIIDFKLCKNYETSKSFVLGMIFLPTIYYVLITKKHIHKNKKKELVEVDLESVKDMSLNLMTQEEYDNLSTSSEESKNIDSIFKSDMELMEDVDPYKAIKNKEINSYLGLSDIEEENVKDINDKSSEENDGLEIVDL